MLDGVSSNSRATIAEIEIGPYPVDGVAIEVDDPAVPVAEPEPVLRGRQGVELNDRLVALHQQVLDDELGARWAGTLASFRESPRQEVGFRLVVTGERMGAFNDPVDLIGDMLEKARTRPLARDHLKIFCT